MENEPILKVSLKEYKQQLEELRASLLGLEETSDEYKRTAEEIRERQAKLNEVMSVGKSSVEGAEGSYNKLRATMSKLKKEWQTMKVGSEAWVKTGKEINNLNSQLKKADASIGNFQRNVGDYANQFKSAFGSMNVAAGKLSGGIGGVGKAMKALWGNPWLAIIGAVVTAVMELVKAFKRNEEAMAALNKLAVPFKAIWTSIQQAFDKVVEKCISLIEWFGKLEEKLANSKLGKLLGLDDANEKMRELRAQHQELYDMRKAIEEQEIKNLRENAELERKIAELRIISEDTTRSIAERQKAIKEIEEAQTQIATNNYNLEAAKYNLLVKEHSLTKSNDADRKEEAEQYARMLAAQTTLSNQRAQNAKKNAQINRQEVKTAEEAAKEAYDARKAAIDAEISLIETYLGAVREGSEEELILQKALLEKEKENKINDANFKIKDKEALEKALLAIETKYDNESIKAEEAYNERLRELQLQNLQNIATEAANTYGEGSLAALQANIDSAQYAYDSLKQLQNESDEAFRARQLEAYRELLNAQEAYQSRSLDLTQTYYENQAVEAELAYGKDSLEALKAQLEAHQNYYDNLFQLQGESNDEFRNRQLKALQDIRDAEKAILNQRISNYQDLAKSMASVMGSVSDIWEEQINAQVEAGKMSEAEGKKQFEKIKGLQIAEATVNTIAGAVAAFMSYQSYGQPIGAILGAAQAAAVSAAGIAQINKIRNTKFGGSSSAGGSMATVAATPTTPDYVPPTFENLTGAQTTDNLANALAEGMKAAPIWVSVHDINNMQAKVQTVERESTF